jgi:hypothetical protein
MLELAREWHVVAPTWGTFGHMLNGSAIVSAIRSTNGELIYFGSALLDRVTLALQASDVPLH